MGNAERVARRIVGASPSRAVRTDIPLDCLDCGGLLGRGGAEGCCRECCGRGPAIEREEREED